MCVCKILHFLKSVHHANNRSGSKGLHCDRQYQTEDTGKEAVKQLGSEVKKKMLQSTDRPVDHIMAYCSVSELQQSFPMSVTGIDIFGGLTSLTVFV